MDYLLDANLVLEYYVSNFVIAEVFSNFAKYSFGRYNRQVKKNGGTIDTRVYQSLCDQFHKDIHNGRLLYQLELNRYHTEIMEPKATMSWGVRHDHSDPTSS